MESFPPAPQSRPPAATAAADTWKQMDPFCGLNPLRAAAETCGRRWAASDVLPEAEVWDGRKTNAASFVRRNPAAALKAGRFVKPGQTLIGGEAC